MGESGSNFRPLFFPVAGFHVKRGAHTGRQSRLQVRSLIAYHPGLLKAQVHMRGRIHQHSRIRLPVGMIVNPEFLDAIAVIRTGPYRIDPGARSLQAFLQRALNALKLRPRVITSADPGLIRDHHHRQPRMIEGANRLLSPVHESKVLGPGQIPCLFRDDPVAIQKNRGAFDFRSLKLRPDSAVDARHSPKSLSSIAAQIVW